RAVDRDRLGAGLAHRPALPPRLEVEPGHLLGGARLRRRAVRRPGRARAERGRHSLERHPVVGLERRRLAVSHGAVRVLESQKESPPAAQMTIGATYATSIIVAYSRRARSRPRRTARVRFPARRSVSMSRTLFTTRIAAASSPTGTLNAKASHSNRSTCT